MNTPFLNRESSALFLLQEKADANGKHREFRDPQGATFARMAKVYTPVDPVLHLFLHLFPALQNLRYTRSK